MVDPPWEPAPRRRAGPTLLRPVGSRSGRRYTSSPTAVQLLLGRIVDELAPSLVTRSMFAVWYPIQPSAVAAEVALADCHAQRIQNVG